MSYIVYHTQHILTNIGAQIAVTFRICTLILQIKRCNAKGVIVACSQLPYLSRNVRKPDFCICENKDADQLRGNREVDQRLCFRYTGRTIPLLPKSEISSL